MNQTLTINLHRVDDKKPKANSTLIVDLLKKFDIPGRQAVMMFHYNGPEYLVRKCYQLEYRMSKNLPVDDKKRWLTACINNNWSEPPGFNDWYKSKKEYVMNNGNDDLRQLLSV